MATSWHRFVWVGCSAAITASCDLLKFDSGSSPMNAAEELAGICVELEASYVPPFGSRSREPQPSAVVVRQLGLPSHAGRVNAARRILEHSECYDSGVLLGAIRIAAAGGDPRPLRHLEEIATGRGYAGNCRTPGDAQNDQGAADDDEDAVPDDPAEWEPVKIRYGALARLSAAAAIGRIIEMPLVPSGVEAAELEPGATEEALAALSLIAACANEPADLRTSAIESMGIIRDPSVEPLLELLAEDPGGENATSSLVMKLATERSQTTILVNNHSAGSSTAAELADLLREYREEGGAP